jgi:hypothetical protein
MAMREGERNGVGTHRSASRCAGDVVGSPFFSRAAGLFDSVDDCTKGCHIRGLPTGSVRVAYVNYREKRKCRVYQVSPTGCTLI